MLANNKLQQTQGMENLYEQRTMFPLKMQAAQLGIDQQKFDQTLNPLRKASMGLQLSQLGLQVNSAAIDLDLKQRQADITRAQLPAVAKLQDLQLQNGYVEAMRQKGQAINALGIEGQQSEVEGQKAVQAQGLVGDLFQSIGTRGMGPPAPGGTDLPVPGDARGSVFGTGKGGDPNQDSGTNRGVGMVENHLLPGISAAMSPEYLQGLAGKGVPIYGATVRVSATAKDGTKLQKDVVVGDQTQAGLDGTRVDLHQGDKYNAADSFNGAKIDGIKLLAPGVVDPAQAEGGAMKKAYNTNVGAMLKAEDNGLSLDAQLAQIHDDAGAQAIADKTIGMMQFLERSGGIDAFAKTHPREAKMMGDAISAVGHQPLVQKAIMSRQFDPMSFQLKLQNVDPTTIQTIKSGIDSGAIRNQGELAAAVGTAQEQQKIRQELAMKNAGKVPENVQWLTTQFNADDRIKNFPIVNSAYENINALRKDLNGNEFNDMALVDSLNRMLNPGGIVRPQTVELMTKMVPGWQNVWNVLTNKPIEGGKLPPSSRLAVVALADTEIAQHRKEVQTALYDWGRLATNMGVAPTFLPQYTDAQKGIIGGAQIDPATGKPAAPVAGDAAKVPPPAVAPMGSKVAPITVDGQQKQMVVNADGSVWLPNGSTVPVGGAFQTGGKTYRYLGPAVGFTSVPK